MQVCGDTKLAGKITPETLGSTPRYATKSQGADGVEALNGMMLLLSLNPAIERGRRIRQNLVG